MLLLWLSEDVLAHILSLLDVSSLRTTACSCRVLNDNTARAVMLCAERFVPGIGHESLRLDVNQRCIATTGQSHKVHLQCSARSHLRAPTVEWLQHLLCQKRWVEWLTTHICGSRRELRWLPFFVPWQEEDPDTFVARAMVSAPKMHTINGTERALLNMCDLPKAMIANYCVPTALSLLGATTENVSVVRGALRLIATLDASVSSREMMCVSSVD